MRNLRPCPKCGQIGLWELQYEKDDNSWQIQCQQCSKIVPIGTLEVPLEARRKPRQYEVADIPSPTDCITSLSTPFGYYRPSIKREIEE